MDREVVVIGAGVSGITAAIYLKRAGIDVCLLERSAPGGQINKTSIIENYPGFIGTGPELAMVMYEQVNKLGIPYMYGDVLDIRETKDYLEIITDMTTITSKRVIVATGRIPNKLGLTNEDELTNHGISWCAICDGPLFKGKTVAVTGSGNSALEEGLYLASICHKVIFINRSSEFKGSRILIDKIKNCSNTEIYYNTVINKINATDGNLSSLELSNNNTIDIDGLFIYIGFQPDVKFLQNMNLKTINNYLEVDKNMMTSSPKVYACGDVIYKDYYQVSTAVGEGTVAALSISRELS